MNELLNMRLFGLLSQTSQKVTNEEFQNAYGEFLSKIESVIVRKTILQLIEF